MTDRVVREHEVGRARIREYMTASDSCLALVIDASWRGGETVYRHARSVPAWIVTDQHADVYRYERAYAVGSLREALVQAGELPPRGPYVAAGDAS